ncbi:poly(beta-D-mannuronate) lyase [Pseudopedobacter saltans DSM 12145]|uniref:Poly(Beta-D-mannuronate) lyase n=1 Tax=Pseudopedobacter saltans (strain ATCC 51119 / DSM 12145 / JCM 21818 / CCUG 39354 / LMG 10337 / NBRC 100064 / NCIMB 13643) TaxID=762903 RepID=F0S8L4_PSESL|nr:polysaccharide lyase 6 family protein [Pseudopedobacter saltans]ADY51298.1 poly(beta-D-mannuronate) lyase [Pseudopedobacter saltans DSM 12145]
MNIMRLSEIKFSLLLIFILQVNILNARDYIVNSAKEIDELNLVAGDKVLLKKGVWKNQTLIFKGKGTLDKPIVFKAEKEGETIVSGNSTLVIDGEFLIVQGLVFRDGEAFKKNVIAFSEQSKNCRLTNTSITKYDNSDKKMRNSWIVLYGEKNRVDHCYVKGKTSLGTTVGVYVSNKPNYHRIDHNYFDGRPPYGGNGGEIIRAGVDQTSLLDSYTTIENNIFDNCDGEIEVVSNKSTHNTIRNNLFFECSGMLTLRHGNYANVYDNLFIGNKKKDSGGVRIIGENHKVYNNYFHGLTGRGLSAAITFMNAWENPPLWGYWQVKNAEVYNNTLIDCEEPFVIGSGKNEKTFLPLLNTNVFKNYISGTASVVVWEEATAKTPQNVRFNDNLLQGNTKEPGFTAVATKNRINKYDLIYPKEANSQVGFPPLTKEQVQLLEGKDIGPAWQKLNKKFKIKNQKL